MNILLKTEARGTVNTVKKNIYISDEVVKRFKDLVYTSYIILYFHKSFKTILICNLYVLIA